MIFIFYAYFCLIQIHCFQIMSRFRLIPCLMDPLFGNFGHMERRMAMLDRQFDYMFNNMLRLVTDPGHVLDDHDV